jgi:GT2 family glycosyltransferase
LLNNDTEVSAGWASACLRQFADPTIGSVAPLVLRMDDRNIIDSAGQHYHICGWASDRGFGQRLSSRYLNAGEVFGPCASSGFYRREALQRIGGLLPEFEAYLDDVDLSFRLRWAGYRCVYEPESLVYHSRSASYGREKTARLVRMLARNEELVWWNNLPMRRLLLGLPAHLTFVAVRLLRSAAAGRLAPFVQGKLDAFGLRETIRRRRCEVHALAAASCDLHVAQSIGVVRDGLRWLSTRRAG